MNKNIRYYIRKFYYIYPFLFSICPYFIYYTKSYPYTIGGPIIRDLLFLLLFSIIEIWFFSKVFNKLELVSVYSFILNFYIYYLNNIIEEINEYGSIKIPLWLYFFVFMIWIIILSILIYRWKNENLFILNNYFALFTILIFVIYFVPFIQINTNSVNISNNEKSTIIVNTTKTNKPNIYYFILDAYGRNDVLKSIYGFDNSNFLNNLRDKGFFVANNSRSNYNRTQLSVASSLNLNYLHLNENTSFISEYPFIQYMLNNNEVMEFLKANGYKTYYVQSGYESMKIESTDFQFGQDMLFPNTYELMYLDSTFWGFITGTSGLNITKISPRDILYDNHRKGILSTFTNVEQISHQPGPKFVFVHILSPHPPFIFSENGDPIINNGPYCACDGNAYNGSTQEYKALYINQIKYINQRVLEFTSYLQAIDDPNIIIVQGDHGPRSDVDLDYEKNSCIFEATSILNVYYFPDQDYKDLYQSISPVNTFRAIFNKYFDTNMNYYPDQSFFSSLNSITNVTNSSNDHCR
jgi:hypothetical protein